MKKSAKKAAVEPLAAEDNSGVLELLRTGRIDKRTALKLLRKIDLKKAGLIAGGSAVLLSAVSLSGHYGFYKGVVAGELKRQLAPVNKKLDELMAQNEALRGELATLKAQDEAESEKE